MTFWQAFKATYSGGVAFLIACPLLALIPVAFELLQHAVEVHIGMYDSVAAAKATEHHPLRMAFGMLKVAALTVPFYWITRFQPDRDAGFAARPDPKAVRLFAGFCQAFGNCTGRTVLRIARIDIPLAAISDFEIENLLRI